MNRLASLPTQTIVVVNGSAEIIGMLETALDAGCYDMVFVDAVNAYRQIRAVQPSLVILCTRIEALEGFQLLTMLKLDAETRDIPVLTYTTEYEGQEVPDETTPEIDDVPTFGVPAVALRMN